MIEARLAKSILTKEVAKTVRKKGASAEVNVSGARLLARRTISVMLSPKIWAEGYPFNIVLSYCVLGDSL